LIDHPESKRRIVVSGELKSRRTDDGIDILSTQDFLDHLWAGELF
jgi:hypothetical protein